MKSWFDYRAERAARMRLDGWSWQRLAEHFEVSAFIVKTWVNGPRKRERRSRNHCGYRETGRRNDYDHQQRVLGHIARIRAEGVK